MPFKTMSNYDGYDSGDFEECGQENFYDENVSKNVSKEKGIFTPSPAIVLSEKRRQSTGDTNGIIVLGRKSNDRKSNDSAWEKTLNLRKRSITSGTSSQARKTSWASPSIPTPSLREIISQEQLESKTPVNEKKESTCPTVPRKSGDKKFRGVPLELDWGNRVKADIPKIKTRMCKYFRKNGKCNRKFCTYAHSRDELPPEYQSRWDSEMEKETERKEKKEKTNVLPESSEKTQMCRNIARYGQCTRDVCTYAHSLMELKPRKCFFKDECTNIGSKTHPCRYIHPSESFDEYVERTKYKEFVPKHIPSPMELPIPEKRTIISEEVSRKPELTYAKVVRCEERRETGNFEITMYGYGYRVPRELVSLPPITIRCPKEFVEGIVGLAFARGMKNIRINSI